MVENDTDGDRKVKTEMVTPSQQHTHHRTYVHKQYQEITILIGRLTRQRNAAHVVKTINETGPKN